jgi:hypothetical protein
MATMTKAELQERIRAAVEKFEAARLRGPIKALKRPKFCKQTTVKGGQFCDDKKD